MYWSPGSVVWICFFVFFESQNRYMNYITSLFNFTTSESIRHIPKTTLAHLSSTVPFCATKTNDLLHIFKVIKPTICHLFCLLSSFFSLFASQARTTFQRGTTQAGGVEFRCYQFFSAAVSQLWH